MEKSYFSSGAPWESIAGYSRAVKAGNVIEVAGTTAMNGAELVGEGDVYQQAMFIFTKIQKVLEQAGARLEDVVRTRVYLTQIHHWEAAAKAHGEVFGTIRPASTMLAVSALIDPRLLIEIEATAIVSV